MLCKRCAAVIDDGEKICIHCGADQEELKAKKKTTVDSDERLINFTDSLIMFLVGGIPIIGLIALMIWSFGTEKVKGQSAVARAFLLWSILVGLVIIVAFIYLCLYALKTADMQ